MKILFCKSYVIGVFTFMVYSPFSLKLAKAALKPVREIKKRVLCVCVTGGKDPPFGGFRNAPSNYLFGL